MALYVRNSIFNPVGGKPMTLVFPADSLKVSVWQAATEMRQHAQQAQQAGGGDIIDIEVFDHDGDFISASMEAERRARQRIPEPERYRQTLYDFLIANFENPMLKPGATISTTLPSPLEKQEILEVLLRAVKHPAYRGFVINIHDRNGEPVRLKVDA